MAAPHIPPDQDSPALVLAKQRLRDQARLQRRAPDAREAERINALVLDCGLPSGAAIGLFWPLPGEPDLRPAMAALWHLGHPVLLPETTPAGRPLVFRRWRPACAMLPGKFRTRHPDGEVAIPDVVLVPLLAFDRRLHRLGYGGGYYDRTLAERPEARAIGVALAMQEVDSVPVGPHDVPLHGVITEVGAISREGP